VLEYRPNRRLACTWHVEFYEEFRREKPSRATFELEPMGAEVKLTITHDDFEPGSKVYAAISGEWPMVLAEPQEPAGNRQAPCGEARAPEGDAGAVRRVVK
jgi:hypothetical protein